MVSRPGAKCYDMASCFMQINTFLPGGNCSATSFVGKSVVEYYSLIHDERPDVRCYIPI